MYTLNGTNTDISCFTNPGNLLSEVTSRWLTFYAVAIFAISNNRKILLNNFLHQARAEKQQEQLQNIFDSQPDGIIILAAPLQAPPPKPKAQKTEP